jgi:hypothetical protein
LAKSNASLAASNSSLVSKTRAPLKQIKSSQFYMPDLVESRSNSLTGERRRSSVFKHLLEIKAPINISEDTLNESFETLTEQEKKEPEKKIKRDFKVNGKTGITSERIEQLKKVEEIMTRFEKKDMIISRKSVEKGTLIPEDKIVIMEQLDPGIAESIRQRKPVLVPILPAIKAKTPEVIAKDKSYNGTEEMGSITVTLTDAGISRRDSQFSKVSDYSRRDSELSKASDYSQKSSINKLKPLENPAVVRSTEYSRRPSSYSRRASGYNYAPKMEGTLPILEESTAKPDKIKKKAFAFKKLIVKPEEEAVNESDPILYTGVKSKTDCWWSPAQYRHMRRNYDKWKENKEFEKYLRKNLRTAEATFRPVGPKRLSTPEVAIKSTKYSKRSPSMDDITIEPHQTRSFVEYVQDSAQGQRQFNSWIPSPYRPKTAASMQLAGKNEYDDYSARRRSTSCDPSIQTYYQDYFKKLASQRNVDSVPDSFYLQSMFQPNS